jgi:hypothetical protein
MRSLMNEVRSEQQPGDDPSYDAGGAERAPSAPDDRLATTRLPPLAPPPQKQRVPSTPPPPAVQLGPGVSQLYASDGMARPAMSSSVQPRTSWWRTFLASPSAGPPLSNRAVEKGVGMACAGLSLVLLVFGLAVGLRGAPPLSSRSPTVDAALVIAHALVGLGLLAFGAALLLIGERFFVGRSGPDGARPDR